MKKKLALLMAAIMTVTMVPMTAFASTKVTAVDEIYTGVGDSHVFTSRVEIVNDDDQTKVTPTGTYGTKAYDTFEIYATLTNGEFDDSTMYPYSAANGILKVEKVNDYTAKIWLNADVYNQTNGDDASKYPSGLPKACVLSIKAYALEAGDVTVTFSSNVSNFSTKTVKIATAYDDDVAIESAGVVTFVEDGATYKTLEDITIDSLVNNAIGDSNNEAVITLKLKGNYEFCVTSTSPKDIQILDSNGDLTTAYGIDDIVTFLNDKTADVIDVNGTNATATATASVVSKNEIKISITGLAADQLTQIRISGLAIKATSSCEAGDVAKLTVSGDNFSVKETLEVAKMVEEAVTYTVDDDDLPVLYAGQLPQNNEDNEGESLTIYIEENTGDILNTSRKATFTFPEGIEVVDIASLKSVVKSAVAPSTYAFYYEIDENVVIIRYYGESAESEATDMEISFILSAAPSFEGDVTCTLGGEFDDVEFTVATVVAPYTVEAKTSEVLIDYRYVPVNEIVITEAVDGILDDGDEIKFAIEKMDFEDAGTYEVTEGDIEVDVEIVDGDSSTAQLIITVDDASTEASTIVISGLELYLDRTLPVGGYALKNVQADNILWENSHTADEGSASQTYSNTAAAYTFDGFTSSNKNMVEDSALADSSSASNLYGYDLNGIFKYSAVTVNDSYVEVVTAARDQDDSTTNRKIVITIGATTMSVGTETITLDAPAYINSEDYTMLPVRAISEAFGATVTWDDASKTVTVLSGQRIISMTIGSKTMYINGTPVAMNTAAEITNDRTFIPVRDLANSLGISAIDWNEASATVTLN